VKVEVKEISQVVRELTLTVEAEKVAKEYQKALKKVSKMAPPIPGFRKGKAPMSAVEKNYADYVKDELYRDGIDKYLEEAVTEHDIKSISEFYPMSIEWEKGEDLVAVFKFEVNPEIVFDNIEGVEVPFKEISLEEAVNDYFAEMKSKNSQMIEVADEIQVNDSVEFEFTFTFEDETKTEVATIPLSENEADEEPILKDAIGKKIGEKFSTQIRNYRLHTVEIEEEMFAVEAMVNSIQRLQEPEIDDAYAKSLDYENLAAMRESIGKELAKKNERNNLQKFNKQIIDALIRENDFQVPNIIVANEAYRQAKMYSQGQEPDEQMIQIISQFVTPQIKEVYAYEALKKQFPTEVSEEQVEALVAKFAEFEDMTVEEFKEEHKEEFDNDGIKNEALFEQIFTEIAKKIKVVDPEVYAEAQKAKLKAIEEEKEKEKAAVEAEK